MKYILFKSYNCLKLEIYKYCKFSNRASFYVERIDLASKLRLSNQKWQWSRSFSSKKSLTNFQTLTHHISLLGDFTHFEQPFHYKTQKQPILRHLSLFLMHSRNQFILTPGFSNLSFFSY